MWEGLSWSRDAKGRRCDVSRHISGVAGRDKTTFSGKHEPHGVAAYHGHQWGRTPQALTLGGGCFPTSLHLPRKMLLGTGTGQGPTVLEHSRNSGSSARLGLPQHEDGIRMLPPLGKSSYKLS